MIGKIDVGLFAKQNIKARRSAMSNSNFYNIFEDMFKVYQNSNQFKDACALEIMINKNKYEDTLDSMWSIYRKGNANQLAEYHKMINTIKDSGLRVLRNDKTGKHKTMA